MPSTSGTGRRGPPSPSIAARGGDIASALGPDGSLYVGGDFTSLGGTTVADLARWDG